MRDHNNGELLFWPSAACFCDERLWFVYGEFGVICVTDLNSLKTEIVDVIPNEDLMKRDAYYKMLIYKDKMYLVPFWGNFIMIYDMVKGSFTEIPLRSEQGGKFQNAFFDNGSLLLLPSSYSSIVRMNLSTDDIKEVLTIDKYMKENEISLFNHSDIISEGEYVLVTPEKPATIFIYDSRKNDLRKITLDNDKRAINNVVSINTTLYFCSCNTKEIIAYDYLQEREVSSWWPDSRSNISIRRVENYLLVDDQETGWIGIFDSSFSLIDEYDGGVIENRKLYYDYLTGKNIEGLTDGTAYFNNADASLLFIRDGKICNTEKIAIDGHMKQRINDERVKRLNSSFIKENELFDMYGFMMGVCNS